MVYVSCVSADAIMSSSMPLWTELAIDDDGAIRICTRHRMRTRELAECGQNMIKVSPIVHMEGNGGLGVC
jgi:hypothetical protein